MLLLLLSITVGNIHIQENERLNLILKDKEEIIKQQVITEDVLRKEIDKQKQINIQKDEEILKKNKQLELLHKEIEKLKKEKSPSVSVMPSRGEQPNRTLNVIATAYTARCAGCTGITKSGKDVRNTVTHEGKRIIAVDPRVIPLHSIVKVQTQKEQFLAIALDIGGDIKNKRIDLLVKNKNVAFEFGRQPATITILREGDG